MNVSRRALWAAVAGFCHAVTVFRKNPHDHTDPPCRACEWSEPWDRWRRAAVHRIHKLEIETET